MVTQITQEQYAARCAELLLEQRRLEACGEHKRNTAVETLAMLLRCKAVKYDPDKAIALRSMGRWWYTNQFGALGLVDSIIHAINPNTHSVGGVETRAVRCARKERGWTRAEYKRIQHEDRWLEWDGQRKADNGPHGRIQ